MILQVDARVKGPQPQSRFIVIIEPRESSISNEEWISEFPAGYKCGHHTDIHLQRSSCSHCVPTRYSVNKFPRIQSLLKPLPQSYAGDKRITLIIPKRQADSRKSAQQNNMNEASIGQLSQSEEALIEV